MVGRPSVRLFVLAASLGATTACIEPYGGSNVQIDFSTPTPAAARPGETPEANQPPAGTHMVLYATDYKYETDAEGGLVRDETTGAPHVLEATVFRIKEFELQPVINLDSPCFIDLEETRFPGLHVTQFARAVREQTGLVNVGDEFDPTKDQGDVQDVLTAERRMEVLPLLRSRLKAVTSYAPHTYPAVDPAGACINAGGDPSRIPPPSCIDAESNAVRLRLCEAEWAAAGPDFYEGSDKVFTIPLSGKFFGLVEGDNPINSGPVGGASMYVDYNLAGMDVFQINWEYNDPSADPMPQEFGHHFLQGFPLRVTRGVINSRMVNLNDSQISASLAVFADLGDDDVHF